MSTSPNQVSGIRDFYNAAVSQQFLRDFNFRLTNVTTTALTLSQEDEIVYAIAKKLPGRNITDQTQKFMGMDIHYGGSVTYPGSGDYQLSFFMSANGKMREKLERASRIIFNDLTSTGDYRVPGSDQRMTLALIDPNLQVMKSYTLVGVQFRNIGDLNMDYLDGNGKLVTCDCTLAYQWYECSDGSDKLTAGQTL